jgi:branched-chain amino acid transport system substrate-binding protein
MHTGLRAFVVSARCLAATCLIVTLFSACKRSGGGSVASGSGALHVKIISSLPRTGSANAQTTSVVNGIRMAIDDAGRRAGRFSVVYEDWDDASARKGDWDPEVEASNAHKAVKDPDVMIYIGTYNSGAAKISMPILNKAALPMISPANTYTGLTKPGLGEPGEPDVYRPAGNVSYFRVVPADDIQGRAGAEWMVTLGGKTVYVLDDRGLYGKGIADVFTVTADKLGIRLLGREGIDPKAQEYRSLMTKIGELDPDWVYFGGTTQTNAGQVAKDLVAVGLRAKLMVPDGCFEQAFIESAGASQVNERVYVTFGGVPAGKLTGAGGEFVQRYRRLYNKEPESYAVYGYAAASAAIDALARAGSKDREAVRRAVLQTKQENGPLGTWSFDANGDTTLSTMSGNVVRNGRFEFATLLGQGKH